MTMMMSIPAGTILTAVVSSCCDLTCPEDWTTGASSVLSVEVDTGVPCKLVSGGDLISPIAAQSDYLSDGTPALPFSAHPKATHP